MKDEARWFLRFSSEGASVRRFPQDNRVRVTSASRIGVHTVSIIDERSGRFSPAGCRALGFSTNRTTLRGT